MAGGTWQGAASISVYPALGDQTTSPASVAALVTAAAAADGSFSNALAVDAGRPLHAIGLGPNGVSRRVLVYGTP